MTSRTREKFDHSSTPNILKVHRITPELIRGYVSELFRHASSGTEDIRDDGIVNSKSPWLVKFWSWVVDRRDDYWASQVCNLLRPFHLLPTTRGSLRRVSSRAIWCDSGTSAFDALQILNVPVLRHGIPMLPPSTSVVVSPNDLSFIIGTMDPREIIGDHRKIVQKFLAECQNNT